MIVSRSPRAAPRRLDYCDILRRRLLALDGRGLVNAIADELPRAACDDDPRTALRWLYLAARDAGATHPELAGRCRALVREIVDVWPFTRDYRDYDKAMADGDYEVAYAIANGGFAMALDTARKRELRILANKALVAGGIRQGAHDLASTAALHIARDTGEPAYKKLGYALSIDRVIDHHVMRRVAGEDAAFADTLSDDLIPTPDGYVVPRPNERGLSYDALVARGRAAITPELERAATAYINGGTRAIVTMAAWNRRVFVADPENDRLFARSLATTHSLHKYGLGLSMTMALEEGARIACGAGFNAARSLLASPNGAWSRLWRMAVESVPRHGDFEHELGHLIDNYRPWVNDAAHEYIARHRTAPGFTRFGDLNPTASSSQFDAPVVRGDFITPYVGRVYRNGGTEVISVGGECLADPGRALELLAYSEEHFALITGIYLALRERQTP